MYPKIEGFSAISVPSAERRDLATRLADLLGGAVSSDFKTIYVRYPKKMSINIEAKDGAIKLLLDPKADAINNEGAPGRILKALLSNEEKDAVARSFVEEYKQMIRGKQIDTVATPSEVYFITLYYMKKFGMWPWESISKEELMTLFIKRKYPKEWGRTFWKEAQNKLRTTYTNPPPILDIPIADKTLLMVNSAASQYTLGTAASNAALTFQNIRLLLYVNPIPKNVHKMISESFKVNCWSDQEEEVLIRRKYFTDSLSSMDLVMLMVSDKVSDKALSKPAVLGFMTLQVFSSMRNFMKYARVDPSMPESFKRKYRLDKEGILNSMDKSFPGTTDMYMSRSAKDEIAASVSIESASNSGSVLYIDLICSRFKFGMFMLKELEKASWKGLLGHQAIALRAIDDVYTYYPRHGYLRTRDNKHFFPIFIDEEDGRAVYAMDKQMSKYARNRVKPLSIFEFDDHQGYLFFKMLPP